jgi:hypothetical protein
VWTLLRVALWLVTGPAQAGWGNATGRFEDAALAARAFVSNCQELGYYKDDVLTVLLPKRRVEAFRIDPQTFAATPTPPDSRLVDEATAYYQTASRAFRSGRLRSPDSAAP